MISYKDAFQVAINFFEEFPGEYVVVGGILTSIYSIPRATQDIEMVLFLDDDNEMVKNLLLSLKENNFIPFNSIEGTLQLIEEGANISYYAPGEKMRLDLKFAVPHRRNSLNKLAFEGRIRKEILGIECWIQNPEVFIINKLVFGGYQDYIDATGAFNNIETGLDLTFLKKTSKEFGVFDLLHSILDGKGPEESLRSEKNYFFPDFLSSRISFV